MLRYVKASWSNLGQVRPGYARLDRSGQVKTG